MGEDETQDGEDSRSKDDLVKHMHSRVIYHENHLGKLCTLFSQYSLKNAAVRDKNDEIAKCIAKFANEEEYNTMAKLALTMVAELMANVGDHMNAAVQRLEAKVLPTLSSYGNICKYLKADIHNAISAESRVIAREKKVKKYQKKLTDPKGRGIVSMAISELEKAEAQSSRLNILAQNQMIKFEQKRMQDMKESLLAFFKIQIALHAKTLDFYTKAYRQIDSIDEDGDLRALKHGLGIEEISSSAPGSRKSTPQGQGLRNKPSEGEIQQMSESWGTEFTRNYVDEVMHYRTSTPNQKSNSRPNTVVENTSTGTTGDENSSESEIEKEPSQKSRKNVSFQENHKDDTNSITREKNRSRNVAPRKSVLTKKHA